MSVLVSICVVSVVVESLGMVSVPSESQQMRMVSAQVVSILMGMPPLSPDAVESVESLRVVMSVGGVGSMTAFSHAEKTKGRRKTRRKVGTANLLLTNLSYPPPILKIYEFESFHQ